MRRRFVLLPAIALVAAAAAVTGLRLGGPGHHTRTTLCSQYWEWSSPGEPPSAQSLIGKTPRQLQAMGFDLSGSSRGCGP